MQVRRKGTRGINAENELDGKIRRTEITPPPSERMKNIQIPPHPPRKPRRRPTDHSSQAIYQGAEDVAFHDKHESVGIHEGEDGDLSVSRSLDQEFASVLGKNARDRRQNTGKKDIDNSTGKKR